MEKLLGKLGTVKELHSRPHLCTPHVYMSAPSQFALMGKLSGVDECCSHTAFHISTPLHRFATGPIIRLMIADPDALKQLMVKDFDCFTDREVKLFIDTVNHYITQLLSHPSTKV